MSGDTRLQRLLQLLRWCGAAMIVTAAGTFLVQRWETTGDVTRYLTLLAATGLLPAVAYLSGVRWKEGRSARVLVLTFLALLPIHAGLLGGFVLSQFGTVDASVAAIAQWVAPTKTAAALLVMAAASVLMPLAWASFRVLARPRARVLLAASASSHSLLLVPSRGAETATLAILAVAGLCGWCASATKPETSEAKLAVASVAAPGAVLLARQLLFYDVTSLLWSAVMALSVAAMLGMGRTSGDLTVERAALIPTLLGMGTLIDALAPGISGGRFCLGYGWATGAALLAMAWTSAGSKRFFVLSSMVINAAASALTLSFAHSPWAALQLLMLGLAFMSYGLVRAHRFAVLAGGSLAVTGFACEVTYAIERFEPSAWLGLAALGTTLVALAAWLERRARAVRPEAATVRVSRQAEDSLSGWQSGSADQRVP